MTETCVEMCEICGYTTNRHLVHDDDGCCYCTRHYLLHLLNDEIKKDELKSEEEKFHR